METPTSAARCAMAGMVIWNVAAVLATSNGVALNVSPPSVDFEKKMLLLPVSGHTAKTVPAALVVMSLPMAVPVVSAWLIWTGACQPEALRKLTNAGRLLCQIT